MVALASDSEIGWDIFNFSSETSQGRNLYKLSQKITLWALLESNVHTKINKKNSKINVK